MAVEAISVSEWLKEMERLTPKGVSGDDGMTVVEMMSALKCGKPAARKFARDGVEAGSLRIGQRHVPKDWDGRVRTYSVFCLVKPVRGKHA